MSNALPGTTGRRRIYLMRHGQVDYFGDAAKVAGDPNLVPLTPLGRDQAAAASKALSQVAFDRAIHSNLPRTEETLKLVLDGQERTPSMEARPALAEIGTGRAADVTTREQLAARLAFHFERASEPGARMLDRGEAFSDAYARATQDVERLLREPGWHTLIIVAHEGINRLILGWATGNGLKAVQAFEQDFACVNILDFDMVPSAGTSGPGTHIERKIIKAVNLTPYNFMKHGMNRTSLEALFEA